MSALAKARILLANCATFQTGAGTPGSASGADDFIYLLDVTRAKLVTDGVINGSGVLAKWYAVIVREKPDRSTAVAGGGGQTFARPGELRILLKAPRAGSDEQSEIQAFDALLQTLRGEIDALAGTNDHIHLRDWTIEGPYLNAEEETDLGPYCWADLVMLYGFDG